MFDIPKYLDDSNLQYNIHNYGKFQEFEKDSISKMHSIIDYSLRYENYLIDYSLGKYLPHMPEKKAEEEKSNDNLPNLEFAEVPVGEKDKQNYERKKIEINGFINFDLYGDLILNKKKVSDPNSFTNATNLILNSSNFIQNRLKDQGIALLKRKKYNILSFDTKTNNRNYKISLESNVNKKVMSYVGLLFPWQLEKGNDSKVSEKLMGKTPALQVYPGIQGLSQRLVFF